MVKGETRDSVERAQLVGCLVVVLIAIGTLAGGSYWFPAVSLARISAGAWRIILLLGIGGAVVAERLVRPRVGRFELYADRIVYLEERERGWLFDGPTSAAFHELSVWWTDVKGFDDSKAEFVKLLTKTGGSSFHTIPTLREADRVAVLRFLDEKGVPRVE